MVRRYAAAPCELIQRLGIVPIRSLQSVQTDLATGPAPHLRALKHRGLAAVFVAAQPLRSASDGLPGQRLTYAANFENYPPSAGVSREDPATAGEEAKTIKARRCAGPLPQNL